MQIRNTPPHQSTARIQASAAAKPSKNRPAHRFGWLHSHPVLLPIFTFVVLLVVSAGTWLLIRHDEPASKTGNAFIVILTYDHAVQTVPTRERTVGALLAKLHVPVNEGDVVEPQVQTKINQDDFRINIYRAVPIEVVDGNQTTFAFSAATTPRSIAGQAGVNTYPEDKLSTKPVTNFVSQGAIGEQVIIDRATPINFNLYGSSVALRTRATTVGELIREKNIRLAKDDTLTPAADTPLTANLPVFVARNGIKLENVTEPITAPVQTILDNTLAYGTSAVRQQGSAGQQVVTYQNVLKNDQVVSRNVVQTVVTVAPVTQIVVQGTSLSGIKGDMALAGIAPGDYNYVDYIISHESGWCPTKAQGQRDCPAVPTNSDTPNGYGLCQSTPGSKMASAGSDWATNPVTQLKWCHGYAIGRYGSWAAAYNRWLNYHNW